MDKPYRFYETSAWIDKSFCSFPCDAITLLCPYVNGGLAHWHYKGISSYTLSVSCGWNPCPDLTSCSANVQRGGQRGKFMKDKPCTFWDLDQSILNGIVNVILDVSYWFISYVIFFRFSALRKHELSTMPMIHLPCPYLSVYLSEVSRIGQFAYFR